MRIKKTPVAQKKCEMLHQLSLICSEIDARRGEGGALQQPEVWPKTRDLADSCGESIYITRTLLLQLVAEGKVIKHSSLLLKSLRWYINKNNSA
ncbi:hypothetical protein EpCFBP13511_07110 [Erwinia persicina]|uniref:FaeA-like family protein n=1 Tax=Erwinia persicina TaxID=55211 RepID=A0A4U3FHL8_9GAMM|nr:hypothetical protein [Erwinia persicina]MBD8210924.1 hypothetical protein [Erwinia persicina]TKJ92562.1 hypothetical protein EpCFBP13511_07110 [Erwinia persicina]